MNKFERFFKAFADEIKSWNDRTIIIIIALCACVAFYCFAQFLKANKSDTKTIGSLASLFIIALCVGMIVLITICLRY